MRIRRGKKEGLLSHKSSHMADSAHPSVFLVPSSIDIPSYAAHIPALDKVLAVKNYMIVLVLASAALCTA